MLGVETTYRITGIRSSGLPFVFWLVLIVYSGVKMRTLALLAEDNVRMYLCVNIGIMYALCVILCKDAECRGFESQLILSLKKVLFLV